MITHHTAKGLIWLDVSSPNDEEIAGLVKRYGLHPLVGEELKSSSSLAKVDLYDDYALVVLTLPVRVRGKNDVYEIENREVDFVIGKNFLITSREQSVEQLEYFSKVFEANSILNKEEKIDHASHLFYYIVKRIYAGMREDLENIKDSLVGAENKIFKGDERRMVEVLSRLSRELIDFKQTARMHHDVWDALVDADTGPTFLRDFDVYIRDIRDEFSRIRERIANTRELLADLRETNDSLLNTRQNEIIKRLALVTFIFQPLTFVAALFTIPASYVPLVEHGYGWGIIAVLMTAMSVGTWWLFRRMRWV